MSRVLTLIAWVYMRCRLWFVSGRAPSRACPEQSRRVQAERSSAAACCHSNYGLAIAAIAFVSLSLTAFAAQVQNKTTPAAKPTAKPPTANENERLYQNVPFGFHYQIPYGWVDRTQEMGSEKVASQPPQRDVTHSDDTNKSKLLLAVFARPPEATGDTVNSAVVIASEGVASYPGLKKAEDYLAPLTELATANGFKAEGEPYALDVESRQLLRADFVKTINDQLTMRQCTLVLLNKGQIVSFTFIAGSDDELDGLMDGLHFTAAKSPAH
jgi:hypothetical protein